jgi:CspA family cold shock protein
MRTQEANGTVKVWHRDEGWGVLTSPDVPEDVWVHFSAIEGSGFRSLNEGDPVMFHYRPARQDGYSYLAVSVRPI